MTEVKICGVSRESQEVAKAVTSQRGQLHHFQSSGIAATHTISLVYDPLKRHIGHDEALVILSFSTPPRPPSERTVPILRTDVQRRKSTTSTSAEHGLRLSLVPATIREWFVLIVAPQLVISRTIADLCLPPAHCDKYLCPHTLSCVHFPHHCPCAFPNMEDKVEFGEGSMACVSKGGFKEGEAARKIELARKGLL